MRNFSKLVAVSLGFFVVLAACSPQTSLGSTPAVQNSEGNTKDPEIQTSLEDQSPSTIKPPSQPERDFKIVTLLPRDGIPAIDNPVFLPVTEADEEYDPDEIVMGVSFNGDSRAYSTSLLSRHEIVNDTVGGVKIAVTW